MRQLQRGRSRAAMAGGSSAPRRATSFWPPWSHHARQRHPRHRTGRASTSPRFLRRWIGAPSRGQCPECGRAHRPAAAADGGCARPNVTARDPGCENFKPIMRCPRQSHYVDGGKAIQQSDFMADAETLKQWPAQWLLLLLKIGGSAAS